MVLFRRRGQALVGFQGIGKGCLKRSFSRPNGIANGTQLQGKNHTINVQGNRTVSTVEARNESIEMNPRKFDRRKPEIHKGNKQQETKRCENRSEPLAELL
jgi:hypothetical protein